MYFEKIASYKDSIEKQASRAWKKHLGDIGEEGVNKLLNSGVFNRQKELQGMRRGTKAILGKENAKLYRSPEKASGHFTRAMRELGGTSGEKFSPEEIADFQNTVRGMGPFGTPMAKVTGMKNTGLAHIPKKHNAFSISNKTIETTNDFLDTNMKPVKPVPRKDRESKKWVQALMERHEADEVRFGRKVLNSKDKTFGAGAGIQPTTTFGGHLTPKVVMAESSNVALAPRNAQKSMKQLRSFNEDLVGADNTEIGTLKNLSGNGFQYGKSGVFDKKISNKVENATNKLNREALGLR